jgi:hypothetical protein
MQQTPELSERRLAVLLKDISEQCAVFSQIRVEADDPATMGCLFAVWNVMDQLKMAAILCDTHKLPGDARRLREFFVRLDRWREDTIQRSLAENEMLDGIATRQEESNCFPMPLNVADPSKNPHVAQWARLLATVFAIDDFVGLFLCSFSHSSNASSENANADIVHSLDYRSVCWYGDDYQFTANQARAIECLWRAWETGAPDVGDTTILAAIDHLSPPRRLSAVFRDHPAWNKMIVSRTKGSHRLQPVGAPEIRP